MGKCLFTDEELGPDTKEEHTIQRALGGRVRSVEVSSSSFNERCGQRVDPYFSGVYADTMRVLGPMLPAETRSASEWFKIAGVEGWWKLDDRGRLTLAGPAVIARDATTRRPLSAIGPDGDSLEPMIEQLGSPPVRRSEVLPDKTDVIFPERAMLHWRIEVAALKALLLTFDHLLKDEPRRFTRSADLAAVRQFVRAVVENNSDGPDIDALADVSLGLQYDPKYLDLYAKLRADAALSATPFRHTLLVSANPATRTLDAVFWAFEIDAHAFRLSSEWSGGPFTFVMSNGILVSQEASQAVRLEGGYLLGKPTNLRCRMRVRALLTEQDKAKAADEIMERRLGLYRRAVDHVERNCDESVREQLSRLARLNANGDHRLTSAVFSHVVTLFAGSTPTVEKADQFINLLIPILDTAAGSTLPAGSGKDATPPQGWGYWLERYRQCLDALLPAFGLPGYIFRAASRTVTNVSPIAG